MTHRSRSPFSCTWDAILQPTSAPSSLSLWHPLWSQLSLPMDISDHPVPLPLQGCVAASSAEMSHPLTLCFIGGHLMLPDFSSNPCRTFFFCLCLGIREAGHRGSQVGHTSLSCSSPVGLPSCSQAGQLLTSQPLPCLQLFF